MKREGGRGFLLVDSSATSRAGFAVRVRDAREFLKIRVSRQPVFWYGS